MKKIINQPNEVVKEMLAGFVYAHSENVGQIEGTQVVYRKSTQKGVGLVSGGGSGHEPAHAGFVGEGMLSAAVLGEMFTSPTPDQIFEAIKKSDTGDGVLLIVKNYTGDVMNFEMAQELAELEGHQVATVLVDDDIAVEDSTYTAGKRGVAGTVFVHKILGHYSREGVALAELKSRGEALVESMKTLGVALTAATNPEVGKPGFLLADDELEFGVGIHGEPGYRRDKIKPSRDIAEELVSKCSEALINTENKRIALLVNGLGATPLMEQYLFLNDVKTSLEKKGLEVVYKKVGNFMTSIDMAGLSLTLLQINESSWLDALTSDVNVISW